MGCNCKKRKPTNEQLVEKQKKIREAMKDFIDFKSLQKKLKSGKS